MFPVVSLYMCVCMCLTLLTLPTRDFTSLDVSALLNQAEAYLFKAARESWTLSQAEKNMEESNLSEDQQQAFLHAWKLNAEEVHRVVVSRSVWNSVMDDISWRIDVKTRTKTQPDLNEPTAIINIRTDTVSSVWVLEGRVWVQVQRFSGEGEGGGGVKFCVCRPTPV